MASPPPPRVPETLEGLRVGALRRTAGALSVHAATDRLGLPVEIHVVAAASLPAAFPESAFLERLRRAADVRHESLLPWVTGGRESDFVYAISKSMDAPALDEVVARGGALAEDRVLAVGAAVAGVLAALERARLRHGDVSPRRILLPGRGQVAVAPSRLLPVAVAPRNERYQSPEEARGDEGDVRSDLFALGLCLLEALRGESAFRGSAAEAAQALAAGKVPSAAQVAGARTATIAVLTRLLAADPAARYPTAAAAEQALAAASSAVSSPVVTVAPLDEAPPETAPVVSAVPERAALAPFPVAAGPRPGTPAATPPRSAEPVGAAIRRSPGRLYLAARLGEALLEVEETLHVGRPEDAIDVVSRAEPFEGAAFRVERTAEADVLVALLPGVEVNGAVVERHALAQGDVLSAPGVAGRYERSARAALRATGAGAAQAAEGRAAARVGLAAALVIALAGVALAVRRFRGGRDAAETAETAARAAESALADEKKSAAPPVAGPRGETTAREQAARDAFEAALAAARKNPADTAESARRFRDVSERWSDTGHGALARAEAADLERRTRTGGGAELDRLFARARDDAARGALDESLLALRSFAEMRPGTVQAERAQAFGVVLENEILARFESDVARAERAAAAGDWARGLRVLAGAMDYVPMSQRDRALAIRARLEAGRDAVPSRPPGPTPGTEDGRPPGPPTVPPPGPTGEGPGPGSGPGNGPTPPVEPPGSQPPGSQPPGIDPEQAAMEAFRAARKAMDAGRDEEALTGFLEFLRRHRETKAGAKYDLEARERVTRLSEGPAGLVKLFRGHVERAEKGRLRIRYDFEHPEQLLDFRDVEAFEAPPRARWTVVDGAVRAKGSGALVLDATFRSEFLTTSVKVNPERAHDLGVAFLDASEPRRFYLFLLQNTFFTLGKGPAAKVFEENAIVLFGPGMWRDTPPSQIGFVRKCGTPEPAIRPGENVPLVAGKADANVWMKFENGKQIQGSAYGDVKLEFAGLEAAVFVLNSGGTFDDLIVEGTPDPEWVARRWRAILSNL